MKIKTKKTMNLPQLIERAWENEIKDRMFLSKCYCVGFDRHGFIYFNSSTTIPLDTMFTVEVEEEITEDTVFENLIEIYETPEGMKFSIAYRNASINYVENDHYLKTLSIHILNDDLTMTLIWTREKGLVG